MEKKSFMVSFEHDKDAVGIAESFGVTVEDVTKFCNKCFEGGDLKASASLLSNIVTAENSGGILMALAAMCLADVARLSQDGGM